MSAPDPPASSTPVLASLEPVETLPGHDDRVWCVAWHPTRPILASSSTDKQLRLYQYRRTHAPNDPSSGRFAFEFLDAIPSAHTRTVRSIGWAPKGSLLASGSFDSTASIWASNLPDPSPSLGPETLENDAREAHSPVLDGQTEAEESWECLMSLEGHESEVKGVAWNRNGSLLATCSRDKSVWIWEVLAGAGSDGALAGEEGYEVVAVLMEHEADVKAVCWSPTEDLLCSTSYDNAIHLYAEDAAADADFALVHRLHGHRATVWDACFAPDGRRLASCSDDRDIRIWARTIVPQGGVEGRDGGLSGGWRIGRSQRERWACVHCIPAPHSRTIYSLDWAPDARPASLGLLASGGADGLINVFEISEQAQTDEKAVDGPAGLAVVPVAQRRRAHGDSDVNDVAWCKLRPRRPPGPAAAPDRALRLLASAGDDGCVRVWDIGPSALPAAS